MQNERCAHTWYLSRNTRGLLLYWRSSSSLRSSRVSSGSPICWLFTGLPLWAMASTMLLTQTVSARLTHCRKREYWESKVKRNKSVVTCCFNVTVELTGESCRCCRGSVGWLMANFGYGISALTGNSNLPPSSSSSIKIGWILTGSSISPHIIVT